MDVRCEKCLTIYEFDETQIGPNGVSVKCTQCGNLFKVKRRDTAELPLSSPRSPVYTPPIATTPRLPSPVPAQSPARPPQGNTPRPQAPPQRATHTGIPQLPLPPVAGSPPAPAPAEEKNWMVRIKLNGEVYRFREMTTLQQWIVERKVTRRDEISRNGDTWKTLGGIAELDSFFQIVDRALAAEQAQSQAEELAFTTTAPMTQPQKRISGAHDERSGPTSMGGEPDPALATTNPRPRLSPAQLTIPPVVDELADLDDDMPAKKTRWPLVVVPLAIAVIGGGVFAGLKLGWFGGKKAAHGADEAMSRARSELAGDTDDNFKQAAEILSSARSPENDNAQLLAQLAEIKAIWAWYLREDARALDAGGPATESVARSLRKQAQAQLDDAKRLSADALQLAPDAPEVNRAMADYQRVDGAPAAEVERYLKRALDKMPGDADALYVAGALAWRENRLDEARGKLEQATSLASSTPQRGLVRAEYLLAKLAMQSGKRDDARRWAQLALGASPSHERARALIEQLDAAPADAGVARAAATPDLAPAAKVANGEKNPEGKTPEAEPESYDKLVEKADRQSENGHSDRARVLYEKALTLQPNGVEAITGLGYYELDREHFMSAIDRFKQALGVAPSYGEALIGLAEAYKVHSDKAHAIEFYKRYLAAMPNGPKASMAKKNLRDLEGPPPTQPPPEKTETNEAPPEKQPAPPTSPEPPP